MCQIGGLARGQYLHVCDVSTRSPVLAVADVFLEVACLDAFHKFFVVCYLHSSVSLWKCVRNFDRICLDINSVLQRAVAHLEPDTGLVGTVVR